MHFAQYVASNAEVFTDHSPHGPVSLAFIGEGLKNSAYIASTAAKVTIAFQRFCSRRFSFSLCWLLSKFTTGIEMMANDNVSAKGAIGTVPPAVRIRTGDSFHVRCMMFVISTETG